jgi:hypothetical protein
MTAPPGIYRLTGVRDGVFVPDAPVAPYALLTAADVFKSLGGSSPAGVSWFGGLNPAGLLRVAGSPILFRAVQEMTVQSVTGQLDIAEGDVASARAVKVPSDTPPSPDMEAAGIPLADPFDANGTLGETVLALSTTAADLQLAAGDWLGVQTTGSWTTSAGSLTIALVPTRMSR